MTRKRVQTYMIRAEVTLRDRADYADILEKARAAFIELERYGILQVSYVAMEKLDD